MYNKISLLIPVYGVEKYIERCARSLFGQTYQNIEYIFVDDCTKDSNKQRGKVVGDSCLAFKTSCFHNVYYKPTLFPGVVFI